ncbi:ATP-NAD kinase family protein [Spiractinospora alimapuensis]|uniref:ATP-NAD kinase family protein n=1 Tax=Spiractinospora alimapuensis TaxID=2820884 RepID=UPI001F44E986|nr:ATP-NAD kinase family protein [Spiractinospora alimapuensis]QVQ52253.1 ATP-NAD kinase family protein [Spiractinospora alimapuensis]
MSALPEQDTTAVSVPGVTTARPERVPAGNVEGRWMGRTLGLIVNPLAGMGGSVGLKGTDGPEILDEAKRRGARPLSNGRAVRALTRLTATKTPFDLVAGAGDLGEHSALAAGLEPVVVHRPAPTVSGPDDTKAVVKAMSHAAVDLLLFAGGDGTARDILSAVGDRVPVLGIPAGVKMHSAVFGASPENAGRLAALFLDGDPAARLRDAEIMDLDETAFREDRLSARLHGYARSPYERHLAQNAKAGSRAGDDAALEAACQRVAARMREGVLYVVGPGTTMRRVMDSLGLPSTLLGVDAVLDGALLGSDLDEQALLRLMEGRETRIVVGVLGGQGYLFGRGNQQISAEVIRRVGREGIVVVAPTEKLIALETGRLRVDTGDAEVDAMLVGHLRLHTGPDRSLLVRVLS